MIGIYTIINLINNKRYIGQSIDIENRFIRHKSELNNNRHVNRHLQASWNKYGMNNFKFQIIEECTKEELNTKEQYWIKFYDTYNDGYNMDFGGDGILGCKHTASQISKMRKIQNPNPVLRFDHNYIFLGYYEGGVSHAAKSLNYTKECILRCCKHTGNKIDYKNNYWVYEEEYLNDNFSWEKYLTQTKACEVSNKNHKKCNSKKICQYDLKRNLIKVWDSFSDIEQAGFTRNQVNTICNKRKGKKTHKGYIWAYDDYEFSDGYFDCLKCNSSLNKQKKIIKYNFDGSVINVYDSLTLAAYDNNIDSSCISYAAKNHSVAANFLWAYANNDWIKEQNYDIATLYNKSIKYQPKKVIQFDQNHKYLNTYNSTGCAAKELNIKSQGNIVRAIKNNTTCAGYYWKYA